MDSITITSGEFAGWQVWPGEPYEHDLVGPFYFCKDEKGPLAAFRSEHRHMNNAGVVHGGCLMSFADFALGVIAMDTLGETHYMLTVAFNCEFLAGAKMGQLIEARGDIMRAGQSLIFIRGLVCADGNPVLNFSSTIKRVRISTNS